MSSSLDRRTKNVTLNIEIKYFFLIGFLLRIKEFSNISRNMAKVKLNVYTQI